MKTDLTHDQLVAAGRRWLSRNHGVVATELVSGAGETPDVIGWSGTGGSTVIECKVSRSDFLADAKKYFRRTPNLGMGTFRYYLTPPGLLAVEELPERWGLLESSANGTRIRVLRRAEPQESYDRAETLLLVSLLRRGAVAHPSISLNVYSSPIAGLSSLTVRGVQVEPLAAVEDAQAEGGRVCIDRAVAKRLLRTLASQWKWHGSDPQDRLALLHLRDALMPIEPDPALLEMEDPQTERARRLKELEESDLPDPYKDWLRANLDREIPPEGG
jgi:hypothetical protein